MQSFLRSTRDRVRENELAYITIGIPLLVACIKNPSLLYAVIFGFISAILVIWMINRLLQYDPPSDVR